MHAYTACSSHKPCNPPPQINIKHSRNDDDKERMSTVRHGQGKKNKFHAEVNTYKKRQTKKNRETFLKRPHTHTILQISMNDIH